MRRKPAAEDRRDEEGGLLRIARERARSQPSRDQLDELEAALVERGGAPESVDDEENTKPIALSLSNEAAFLNARIDRLKGEVKRSKTSTANRITDAMGSRPPNERLTAIETRLKIAFAILAAVGSVAAGAAVTVAKGLYERGQVDGQHEIRLQNVERAVDSIERALGMPGSYFEQLLPRLKGTPQ